MYAQSQFCCTTWLKLTTATATRMWTTVYTVFICTLAQWSIVNIKRSLVSDHGNSYVFAWKHKPAQSNYSASGATECLQNRWLQAQASHINIHIQRHILTAPLNQCNQNWTIMNMHFALYKKCVINHADNLILSEKWFKCAHNSTDACRSQTASMQSTQHIPSSLQQEHTYKMDIVRYNVGHCQTLWTLDCLTLSTLDALLLQLLGVGTHH